MIPLYKFRMLFRFNQSISNLDKKRFKIIASAGDLPGVCFLLVLVITWTVASPGDKMFG